MLKLPADVLKASFLVFFFSLPFSSFLILPSQKTAVIDSSGTWLRSWESLYSALKITRLRTPVTLHPHTSPGAFLDYIKNKDLQNELIQGPPGGSPLPSFNVFRDFCKNKLIKRVPINIQKATVISIAYSGSKVTLSLDDETAITAQAVVYTASGTVPVIPEFIKSSPTTKYTTWNSVNLDSVKTGQKISIIGGGCISGHLAEQAAKKGAEVTMYVRREIVRQWQSVDAGWWGAKMLTPFRHQDSPSLRLRMARRALKRGSIPPWLDIHSINKVVMDDADGTSPLDMIDPESEIWIACGTAYDVTTIPPLAALQMECPIQNVGGYPVLHRDMLMWNGAPVFLMGRGAQLSLGPAARDLAGYRLAADRILKAIKSLKYSSDIIVSMPLQPPAQPDAEEPLDERGLAYEDERPRQCVSKPHHLVDISDFEKDTLLEKLELQRYSFTDEGFKIKAFADLIPAEQGEPALEVRSVILERSLDVWVIGKAKAYHLHIPKLWGKVVPAKCKTWISESRRLRIVLFKEADGEWKYLRG